MLKGLQQYRYISVGIVIILIGIVSGFGCSSADIYPRSRVESITFCTDWTVPWTEWILWENGIEAGVYKKHNIQLLIEKPAVPLESLNMLATGWCDIGYAYQADLMVLRTQKRAPVEAIAAFFPGNRWGLAYLRSEELAAPTDLQGKQISLYNLQTDHSYFKLWMTQQGYSPTEFTLIEGGDWNTEILQAGHTQAVSAWENSEVPFLEFANPGREVVFVPVAPQDNLPYLTVMAANSRFARRHSGATRRFLAATLESLKDAIGNPARAVNRFLSRHPEIPRSEYPRWHSAWKRAISMAAVQQKGRLDSSRWNTALQNLATIGVLPQNLPENDGFTNSYCPEVLQQ